MTISQSNRQKARSLTWQLVAMAIGAFAFGFLVLPPMYDVFCDVTGLGGRTNEVATVVEEPTTTGRVVRLEFATTVNQYAPWEFGSDVDSMTVDIGGVYETTFTARNLSDKSLVAQAVPSVSPPQAARHFKKLECFCFTSQEFVANEEKQMPVRFIIDSDLPAHIDTVTLSYTFFDATKMARANVAATN